MANQNDGSKTIAPANYSERGRQTVTPPPAHVVVPNYTSNGNQRVSVPAIVTPKNYSEKGKR